jgi:PAS domain S-box-containing protein
MTVNHGPDTGDRTLALREKAERLLREQDSGTVDADARDLAHLVHELEVHRVELEIQNQELRRAQAELEASRDEYEDLYEAAPVGYVTLDRNGLVLRANTAAHEILGFEHELRNRPLSSRIEAEDRSPFCGYLNQIAAGAKERPEPVEVRLAGSHVPACVRIEATTEADKRGGHRRWRVALVDVTRRREAEAALERSEARARAEAEERRHLADRLVELLEEDRRATAMALHDDIGQILAGVKMQLETLQSDLERTAPEPAGRLQQAAESLQEAVSRLRSTSRQLHPASLSVLGLEAALRSLKEEVSGSRCRIHAFFHGVPGSLDPDRSLAVFRIAQEAVTNAVRHSDCREIHLSLAVRNGALHLTVEDDGAGFAYEKAVSDRSSQGPLGLLIMRERAVRLGGTLHVDATPDRGTVVTAEIPLEAAGGDSDHPKR